jgi:hypothetical protein
MKREINYQFNFIARGCNHYISKQKNAKNKERKEETV